MWLLYSLLLSTLLLHSVLGMDRKTKRLILRLHNDARAGEGASNMNQLVWDDLLEKEAGEWAERCVFEHQRKERGENLAYNTAKQPESDLIAIAFQSWFDEKQLYSYGQSRCGSACHYTQIVWHSTRRVGCATKKCANLQQASPNAWYFVCFYDPGGNMMGEKPYAIGSGCSACLGDQTCRAGLCAGGKDPCEDEDANCDYFLEKNMCASHRNAMKFQCKKSCDLCTGPGKPVNFHPNPKKPSKGACADKNSNCKKWTRWGECNRNPTFMNKNCKKSCGKCGGGRGGGGGASTGGTKKTSSSCKDSRKSCARWAKRGECERNPRYMRRSCKKSCNIC